MSDSLWRSIFGQDVAVDLLRRSAKRGRLAHGYAFFGPPGIGRRLVAQTLTCTLFCTETDNSQTEACGRCTACKQVLANNHPDFLSVQRPAGKREIPIDLIAGRPERRGREGLCYELAMRPMSAERRVAVIDDAETMNVESANALLKTLEEPPPGSLVILLAKSPEAILPTIRSRVQPIFFQPLAVNIVADWLVAHADVPSGTASEVAKLSGGSLETATELLDDKLRELRSGAIAAISRTPFSAVQAAAAINNALDDLDGDAATKRLQADWVLRFLAEFFRSAISQVAIGHPEAADSETNSQAIEAFRLGLRCDDHECLERLGLALERLVAAELAIKQMTPVPLAIEGFCDDFSAITRGADRPVLHARN